jgi:urease subunit alpha
MGRAVTASAVTFVSRDFEGLDLSRGFVPVQGTRGIGKAQMVLNDALPVIEVNPETYEVRADGELLTCTPADVLPMAQRYFLF